MWVPRKSQIFQIKVHCQTVKLNPPIQVIALVLVHPDFSNVAPSISHFECLSSVAPVHAEEWFTDDAGHTRGAWGVSGMDRGCDLPQPQHGCQPDFWGVSPETEPPVGPFLSRWDPPLPWGIISVMKRE